MLIAHLIKNNNKYTNPAYMCKSYKTRTLIYKTCPPYTMGINQEQFEKIGVQKVEFRLKHN